MYIFRMKNEIILWKIIKTTVKENHKKASGSKFDWDLSIKAPSRKFKFKLTDF